jgi:hypothetical protein
MANDIGKAVNSIFAKLALRHRVKDLNRRPREFRKSVANGTMDLKSMTAFSHYIAKNSGRGVRVAG